MRFLIHGEVPAAVRAALKKHEHATHELSEVEGAAEIASDPAQLAPLLEKKQWNLFTADSGLVHALYERKVEFSGIIVLLLPDESASAAAPEPKKKTKKAEKPGKMEKAKEPETSSAIDRLFERYKRLSNRRLYTITPSRVKIRQLPGAGQS